MTEKPEGDAARVRFFPPAVPLLVIALGAGLHGLWPLRLGAGLPASLRWAIGGSIVLAAVLGLGLRSVVLFRRTGQSENPWKPTPELVEGGPFRITRNPMYLQMVVVCVGVAIATANGWVLLLTPVGAWALQRLAIEPEEAYLEQKFGEAYLGYKRRVRRWI